jgi:integrase
MSAPLPLRDASVTLAQLIDLFMADYAGRDDTRAQRLAWWRGHLGAVTLADISDDHVATALDHLATNPPRYYAGKDAEGRPIMKAKRQILAPATVNRYSAALASVFTWAVRKRIAPKGWTHPCRSVERRSENNEQTRFLSKDERERLLAACKASKWPRLYLLVLLAVTTGARRGELEGLRWADVDLEAALAHVGRTKNGDPKALPLVPAVVEQLQLFKGDATALVFASAEVPTAPYNFRPRFAQALKTAKLRGVRFHDLRHTAASHLAQNGATLLEIADLLGHRQMSMTKRYSHFAAGHRSALVNRIMGDTR